ncbi:MAG TPA: hypothetical protein VF058_11520 [Actinomycetota bacterium]
MTETKQQRRQTNLMHVLAYAAVAAAVGLFVFLAFLCPERRAIGMIPMALWVPLILWFFSALRRRQALEVVVAFPISFITLILTVLGICPGGAAQSAAIIGLTGFVVYGLVLAASVSSFERWGQEEEEEPRSGTETG